jgi:Zn-dependent protease with chaperone function
MMGPLLGHWFDGRTSRARLVEVHLLPGGRGPTLELRAGADTLLQLDHRRVTWPEAWSAGRAPRKVVVDLKEHGSLELEDVRAWQGALAQAGAAPALAERMQTRWKVFAAVFLLAGLSLWAFYRWGTPWAATQLARQVPLTWETELSERALRDIDGALLKPSQLPMTRQRELRAKFDALMQQLTREMRRYPGYTPPLTLHFRSGLGANAFALPGGTIVMTDGLVEAAAKQGLPDDALIGVLAHEAGHVLHRHGTRLVVEQAVLNVGLGLAMGDVSSIVSFGAAAVTGLAYRRNHETEADCFAIALMRQARMPTQPMADLLLKLDDAPPSKGNAVLNLLSSHPATHERAMKLKSGDVAC